MSDYDPYKHYSYAPQADLQVVHESYRAATTVFLEKARDGKATETDMLLFIWMQGYMSTWTRTTDVVKIEEIVRHTGKSRSSLYRSMIRMTGWGILHWDPSTTGDSFLSIAAVLTPSKSREEVVSPRRHIALCQPDDTSIKTVKDSEEREVAPAEPVAQLYRDATSRICQHLFHGKQSLDTERELLDRVVMIPPTMLDDFVADAVRRRPARLILRPVNYGLEWIATAEDRVRSGVSRETMTPRRTSRGSVAPNEHDRTIASSRELETW